MATVQKWVLSGPRPISCVLRNQIPHKRSIQENNIFNRMPRPTFNLAKGLRSPHSRIRKTTAEVQEKFDCGTDSITEAAQPINSTQPLDKAAAG